MLESSDLRFLSLWCQARHLSWLPARADGQRWIMVLESRDPAAAWQRMLLVTEGADMRLEDELGEPLACASDLPALLDAVDGGVAEKPRVQSHAHVAGPAGVPRLPGARPFIP
jgi:hypothetical protein